MKRMRFTLALILLTLFACGQKPDDTFLKPMYFNYGLTSTKITFSDGTSMTTVPTGSGTITWANILNKPLVFAPDLTITNPLYKSISYVPTYQEITNKPEEIQLDIAILQIPKLFNVYTQAQIDTLSNKVRGLVVINETTDVMQWWDGTKWRILVTTN